MLEYGVSGDKAQGRWRLGLLAMTPFPSILRMKFIILTEPGLISSSGFGDERRSPDDTPQSEEFDELGKEMGSKSINIALSRRSSALCFEAGLWAGERIMSKPKSIKSDSESWPLRPESDGAVTGGGLSGMSGCCSRRGGKAKCGGSKEPSRDS